MKIIKKLVLAIVAILVLAIALLFIFDKGYILKGISFTYLQGHKTAYIDDYPNFDNRTIKAGTAQPWALHKNYNSVSATKALQQTNKDLGTVAFLIIKNDSIWYENYADGYSADSKTNSFSMAKSITSALLGKAINDGYIKGLNQPVSNFFPQFDKKLTIGELSSMSSGLNWKEDYYNPFGMTAQAYLDEDIRSLILNLKVTEQPGKSFKYLSGNTELLGLVIEKATKKNLSQYLSESFWQPMGMHQEALWQLDSEQSGMEKAYCCIASNARDFAKFGKLYSQYGKWNGQQLVDSSFVATSTKPKFKETPFYGYGFWLSNFMDKEIFTMRGILGQYVISIPEDNLIIVRLGHQRGERVKGENYNEDFFTYIRESYHMLNQD